MRSSIQNYVVFDIETGGLFKEKNPILEIAACSFNQDLDDLQEFESGVMNNSLNLEIQPAALQANGITMDQINNGADPKQVIELFCKYLNSLKDGNTKPVLVGQNSDKFDIPFLSQYMEYFGKDLSKLVNTDFTIDTMWWGRIKYKELANYKLGTLCSENGIELINAHRALNDTRATKDLIKVFIRSLRSEGSVGIKSEKRSRKNFEL